MALQAQLRPAFVSTLAQFRAAWAESAIACPTVTASNVHVINLQTGATLYTKGTKANEDIPASLTKLMTAYVVTQHRTEAQLHAETTVFTSGDVSDGTTYNLVAGDVITLHALLVNTLLPSDNSSASALARVVGLELLGGSGTEAAAKARFITEMNTQAAALGMLDSTFYDAHGVSTSNTTTPDDINKIAARLVKNAACRNIWRFTTYRLPVIRGGSPLLLDIVASNDLDGRVGIVGGKTGTLGMYNLTVLWEAPNGHMIALTTMGDTSDANRYTSMSALLAALPTDYPTLATAGTPFTPARLFDTLGYGGGWFDGSDMSTMWQDAAGTTAVTAESQPVGKWTPKAGTAGLYFRQATAGKRPTLGAGLVFDGADDYLDLGTPTFGTTRLFADSTDKFIVAQKYATSAVNGTAIAKSGASASAATFKSYYESARSPGVYVRGTLNGLADNLNTGASRAISMWWDGADGAHTREQLGSRHTLVGTAAEETTQNILLGAINGGASSFLNGSVQQIVLVDTFDTDAMRRLRDWSNGATINAFGYSAGEIGAVNANAPGGTGTSAGSGSGGTATGVTAGSGNAPGGTGTSTGSGSGGAASGGAAINANAPGGAGTSHGSGRGGVATGGGLVEYTRAPTGSGYKRRAETQTRPPQTNTVRH